MLISLHVTNFAIVENLELDFAAGMSTFTGETGAGKSIMIDALTLALGGRADSSVLRNGANQCEISAVFGIAKSTAPYYWCKENDIELDDFTVILRRVINKEGRAKCYINGQPHSSQKVKELSSMLVDIHGQHQHQTLLNHQTHRMQLDVFAGHSSLCQEVSNQFKLYQQVSKQLDAIKQKNINQDRFDLLTYQVQELDDLALEEGELTRLNEEHAKLHHAKSYLENTRAIIDYLNAEDAHSLLTQLATALNLLSKLPKQDEQIIQSNEMLNSALIQCQEALSELERFEQNITIDPQRLFDIENRLESIHDIARKHHLSPNELTHHHQQLKNELTSLSQVEQQIQSLENELGEIKSNYLDHCQQLSSARKKAAKKLAHQITQAIRQLGMPKGCVEIEIKALDSMHAHGMDKVEYKVCTNPGMTMDSLAKVASGGELSRISLAIQVITAQKSSTPTLLFDEVDVGIGGATAAMVGQLLRNLGKRLQVFCVTHQAQVAANAHHHYLVSKHDKAQKTYSTISRLDESQKVSEIARMLGGLTITEHTLSHAKELLVQINDEA